MGATLGTGEGLSYKRSTQSKVPVCNNDVSPLKPLWSPLSTTSLSMSVLVARSVSPCRFASSGHSWSSLAVTVEISIGQLLHEDGTNPPPC